MLNQETVVRYHYLLSEANEVEKKLQAMALKVEFSEDDMEEEMVGNITELNSKLEQIQQDVEIILNPNTRYKQFLHFLCVQITRNYNYLLFSRMLLFGAKVTRVKRNEDPEVLLVVQDQSCLSLHQTLNKLESEFNPQLSIRFFF